MYYCRNCHRYFRQPITVFEPYPEYGGEYFAACPHCRMADAFEVKQAWDENE